MWVIVVITGSRCKPQGDSNDREGAEAPPRSSGLVPHCVRVRHQVWHIHTRLPRSQAYVRTKLRWLRGVEREAVIWVFFSETPFHVLTPLRQSESPLEGTGEHQKHQGLRPARRNVGGCPQIRSEETRSMRLKPSHPIWPGSPGEGWRHPHGGWANMAEKVASFL